VRGWLCGNTYLVVASVGPVCYVVFMPDRQKLWKLTLHPSALLYSKIHTMMIRAHDELTARWLAVNEAEKLDTFPQWNAHDPKLWLEITLCKCEQVRVAGEPEVLVADKVSA
jgi:hypothetical protein